MAQFRIIRQDDLKSINHINEMKLDNMYVTIDEYNGYSTIIQYSSKYDNFKIISVPTERLDKNYELN